MDADKALKMREWLVESEKSLVKELDAIDGVDEYYKTITLANGYKTNLKIWRSNSTSAAERPLILLFHGGGFFAGSEEMMTRPGREFAKEFNAVVVSSSYRLAPEDKWPTSTMDGLEVTKWLSAHAKEELEANPEKGFIVGGFSAGGNMAAVIAHQALKEPLTYPITGSFISIPLLVVEAIVPAKYKHLWTSRQDNSTRNKHFSDKDDEANVKLIEADVSSPLFSPMNGNLTGLPRTFLQMGDLDPLRDDGIIYAKALEDAGVEVRSYVQPDEDHQCFSIWYNEEKGSHNELKIETMKGVAWLLRREYTGSA